MNSEGLRSLETSTGQAEKMNARTLSTALVLTFAALNVFVALMWLNALQSSSDGVTTSSGARAAIVALSACFSLAVMVRQLEVWTPRWLPWAAVVIISSFILVAALLFQTGNLDAAFAFYGGFQVPRAGRLFSDSHIILSWFSCDLCSEWDPRYGPGLAALKPLTFSTIGVAWLPFVGTALVALALVTIFMLVRSSQSLGRWVVVAGAFSPPVLLLVERANWDVLILGVLVVGAVVVSAKPTMITWTGFALAIWLLGAIKIYPFALGVVLLLALTLRLGWVIPAVFLAATGVFAAMNSSQLTNSGKAYSDLSQLDHVDGSSPAYGRILLSERLEGLFSTSAATAVTLVLLFAILAFSSWWGWLSRNPEVSQKVQIRLAVLSLAGATAFLAKALIVGFGFAYAGAALLLVVPAVVMLPGLRSLRNGSLVALSTLVLVAIFGSYNVVLGTLAGFVVAGFGLGFGARSVWETVHGRWSQGYKSLAVTSAH